MEALVQTRLQQATHELTTVSPCYSAYAGTTCAAVCFVPISGLPPSLLPALCCHPATPLHLTLRPVYLSAVVCQKYDFIINKLVAAVDAEFTLLNNKLALAQQFPPPSTMPTAGATTPGTGTVPPQQHAYPGGVSTEQY